MTKINDYLWQLPHPPSFDDPPDVTELQQRFNAPIAAALEEPLAEMGYALKSNDVAVQLNAPPIDIPGDTGGTHFFFIANIRFICYLQTDIITRVHFEHASWSILLPQHKEHQYYINLDRFKISDPATQRVVPSWSGRLHTRMSNRPGVLHHAGEDQIWMFSSGEQLEQQLQQFLELFSNAGKLWLEDTATL